MPKRFFFNGSHPSCPFNSRPLLTKPPRKSNPANKTSRMRGWDDEHEMRSWMCLAPSSWFYINHYSSMVHILGGGNPPILTLEYCCQLWPLWLFWNHLPSGTAWRVFASWFPDSTFKKAKGLVSSKLDQPESYIYPNFWVGAIGPYLPNTKYLDAGKENGKHEGSCTVNVCILLRKNISQPNNQLGARK